ncbi:MAG: Sec-independent protein translocase protein TatB [Pseudomonadota bacterium]
MFDFGWSELLIVGVVAILVVGPRELPGMLRAFGKTIGQVRRMAGEFQTQFNDALKDADLDEVRQGIESVRSASSPKGLASSLNPLKEAADDLKKSIESPGETAVTEKAADQVEAPAIATKPSGSAPPAAKTPQAAKTNGASAAKSAGANGTSAREADKSAKKASPKKPAAKKPAAKKAPVKTPASAVKSKAAATKAATAKPAATKSTTTKPALTKSASAKVDDAKKAAS